MNNSFISLICIVLPLIISLIIINKRKEEESKRKQKLHHFFKDRIEVILQAHQLFNNYLNLHTGYFSNYTAVSWQTKYTPLYNEIKNVSPHSISLITSEIEAINKFKEYISNTQSLRAAFNLTVVKSQLIHFNHYFDNIEGRKLDNQQREAIIINEDHLNLKEE